MKERKKRRNKTVIFNYRQAQCIVCLFLICILSACEEEYSPKPYGYYRIDFPEKSYKALEEGYPYRFEVPSNAIVEQDRAADAEPYWVNIYYPAYQAKIHISYKKIESDTSLASFQQDCHRMAYTHTIKAESINEQAFHKDPHTFGLVYLIEGNTASSTQFFVTDSTKNFLRGSLYFNSRPNKDSLAPIINYIRQDVINLIETIEFNY